MSIETIYNLNAGKSEKSHFKIKILAELRGDFHETKTVSDLERAVAEISKKNPDYIGICGGDGTLKHTITKLKQLYNNRKIPAILYLPTGTINNLTDSLNYNGDYYKEEAVPVRVLCKFLDDYKKGTVKTKKINVLKVNKDYGLNFGIGLITEILRAYYNINNITNDEFQNANINTGIKEAVHVAFKSVLSSMFNTRFARERFKKVECEVTIDGKKLDTCDITAIYASTYPYIHVPLKFYISPRAFEKKDKMHAKIVWLEPVEIIKCIPALYSGKKINHPKVIDDLISELKIESDKEIAWQLDGEFKKDKIIKVSVPEQLEFVF